MRHGQLPLLAEQPTREAGGELLRLLQLFWLHVGSRDTQPQVLLAVLPAPQVAGQRQHRTQRVARIGEVNLVDEFAALLLGELTDRREVFDPILTADYEHRERLALQQFSSLIRLQERTYGHARRLPPGRRADTDQVVVAVAHRIRGSDFSGVTALLGRQHAEHVGPYPSHRKSREPFGIPRIGELDRRLEYLAPALAELLSCGFEYLERLPRLRVVQQQDPRCPFAAPFASDVCHRASLSNVFCIHSRPSALPSTA